MGNDVWSLGILVSLLCSGITNSQSVNDSKHNGVCIFQCVYRCSEHTFPCCNWHPLFQKACVFVRHSSFLFYFLTRWQGPIKVMSLPKYFPWLAAVCINVCKNVVFSLSAYLLDVTAKQVSSFIGGHLSVLEDGTGMYRKENVKCLGSPKIFTDLKSIGIQDVWNFNPYTDSHRRICAYERLRLFKDQIKNFGSSWKAKRSFFLLR